MLELRVAVDKECAECLVYQHQESALRGKLHIKSSDRLKLRQITIRLVSTELVDIHHSSDDDLVVDEGGATGAGGFLQKSTKTVGTWVVLAKGGDSHVLAAGEHQYSFEIALPRGLDGTVDTGAYRLGYELESRVEHSFVLKPATALLTPVTLVQVPMGLNLHSDDRVSMNIVAAPSRLAAPEDVPLGRAVCVHADAIDQGRAFVLRHLWDAAIAVRLRLPRGRVFATDAHAVVDVQAVPITRDYRCTSVTLRLEEIAIIARPQRSAGSSGTPSVVSGPAARHGSVSGPAARRSSSVAAVSSSSEDSVVLRAAGDSSAAAALAQECSAEYRNAITRVRTLATSTHTAWPDRPNVSLAEFSGIAAARLRLHVSPTTYGATHTHAHTDIRNSHIQVHHQIAYEVRYERIAEHHINSHHHRDSAAGPDARILAVARVYSALGSANIVRRDELKETGASSGGFRVVRGTLPVAIVPKKISALWGLKNAPYDDDGNDTDVGYEDGDIGLPGADPAAASFPAQHNDSHLSGRQVGVPPVSISVSAPSPAYVPSPAMLGMMHGSGNNSSIGMPGTTNTPTVPSMPGVPSIPGVSGMPSFPGMPAMMPGGMTGFPGMPAMMPGGMTGFPGMPAMPGMPSFPSAYPSAAPAAQPMGFNPMMMPQAHASGYPMDNGYGANMPGFNSYDSSSGGGSMPYGGGMGSSNTPAYNPTALQQQIQMFQEQQRMQQQQFFQQLSEQYGQMVVSPHSPSPSPAVSNHYQPHVSSSSSLGSAYNTYGPAPPPPPPQQPTIVVAQEQVTVYTNGSTVATDESLHADLATTVASETAATASSEPSASEGSEPARPDSAAADIDNNTPFVDAVEHSTDAVEPSNRDPEPEIVRPAPAPAALPPPSPPAVVATAVVVEQQPVQQSSTTAAAASNTSNESDVPAVSAGRHSPPPNYDELLPPEYEVPANQPPPYRPLESNRSRRRMWDI